MGRMKEPIAENLHQLCPTNEIDDLERLLLALRRRFPGGSWRPRRGVRGIATITGGGISWRPLRKWFEAPKLRVYKYMDGQILTLQY